MSDLISRQAAIEALYLVNEYNARSIRAIKTLPSAQSEPCEDAVSRNAIIQKLNTMDRYVSEELRLCDTDKKFPKNEVFIADDVYEEIVENLPSAQSEQRWIPVSERLPESDGYYLVTEKSGRICTYVFHRKGNSEECWKRCTVAWMPLPEPYKAESEDKE